MLQNDIVAEFLTQEFNKVAEKYGRKIAIHDGAYDHDNFRAFINGIITLQSPEVLPIMNYVNMNCRYSLDFNLSLLGGFSRLNNINDIIDEVMLNVNGKLVDIAGGQAIFMLRLPSTSDLQIREVIGQSVIPKVIVEVEYSVRTGGTKYQMALIDTVFDNGSVNTRWFASQTEQIEYYNNKVANGGAPYCDLMTPNLNSLTLNKQVYINDLRYYSQGTTKPLDASEILLKNYAIIRSLDETGQATSYYYYYITSATINSNNQISLDLQLDTVQTYYFNPSIEFSDCLINRAHLNRFIDNGDGTVSFDGTETSCLFKGEENSELPKRLVKRSKLKLKYTGSSIFDDWVEENVAFWVYVFLDKQHQYKIKNIDDSNQDADYRSIWLAYNFKKGEYISDLGVVVFPVMASNKHIYIEYESIKIDLSQTAFEYFRNAINPEQGKDISSYFFNIKFSLVSPFRNSSNANYRLDENGNLVFNAFYKYEADNFIMAGGSRIVRIQGDLGLVAGLVQDSDPIESEDYELTATFNFNKNEIIGANKNTKFNPKLLNSNYKELHITGQNGEEYSYDVQKINSNNISILYSEPIQPEVTKYYARIKAPSGLYIEATNESYLGLIGSSDNGLSIANNTYAQFLANNKNFWMQSNLNIFENAMKGAIGGAISSKGKVSSAVTAGIGAGIGALDSIVERHYTIDNMKNAPNSIKNANGNIIFNNLVNEMRLYIEEYEALSKDIDSANENMFVNGFNYEILDNIKNYDHIRKYFNFVQAEVENIGGISISNNAREDLRQRFRNGVRFWNSDNIQYDLENYEIWLENFN